MFQNLSNAQFYLKSWIHFNIILLVSHNSIRVLRFPGI